MTQTILLISIVVLFIITQFQNNNDEKKVEKEWEIYQKQNPLSELNYQKFRDEYYYPKSDTNYKINKISRIVIIISAILYFLYVIYRLVFVFFI